MKFKVSRKMKHGNGWFTKCTHDRHHQCYVTDHIYMLLSLWTVHHEKSMMKYFVAKTKGWTRWLQSVWFYQWYSQFNYVSQLIGLYHEWLYKKVCQASGTPNNQLLSTKYSKPIDYSIWKILPDIMYTYLSITVH